VGRKLSSWFAALAAVALVAIAAGCGGGSSTTTSSSTEASAPPPTSTEQQSSGAKPSGQANPKARSGEPKQEGQSAGAPAETAKLKKQISKEEEEPGDHSIQEYGSEASGEQEKAVLSAMRTFIADLATSDYNGVCAGLAKSNREQLEKYVKATGGSNGCAGVLKKLLVAGAANEAKKNVNATIGRVRVGEGSAFVLFRPLGGKLSYFVLKEEDGEWKSVSLAPGTPLAP
jgi:hypothetical protein